MLYSRVPTILFNIPLAILLFFYRMIFSCFNNFFLLPFSLLSLCKIAMKINIVYDLKVSEEFLELAMFSNFSFTLQI